MFLSLPSSLPKKNEKMPLGEGEKNVFDSVFPAVMSFNLTRSWGSLLEADCDFQNEEKKSITTKEM